MAKRDIVVVGDSAGGVEALKAFVTALPPEVPAAIFVVMHISPHVPTMLPELLDRAGVVPASHPEDGAPIARGRIYVAPSDRHMVLEDGRVRLMRGPRENRFRPAIDTLFRSAAASYGSRVVGVVLSGSLTDGVAGLAAIKKCGGTAVVQHPGEALFCSMPQAALEKVAVDYTLPADEIGRLVAVLAEEEAPATVEVKIREAPAHAAVLSCPDCHGTLWEVKDGASARFRCRVGHSFSLESLVESQDEDVERAIWAAIRGLEESAALSRRLAHEARERGHGSVAERFDMKAGEKEKHAAVLRKTVDV